MKCRTATDSNGVRSILRVGIIISVFASGIAQAQDCPLTAGRTGHFVTYSNDTGLVMFGSGLAVNADGAPNAYHRLLGPATRDPGLLHICNGAEVLEQTIDGGRMRNRYPDFSVPGSSARCKADVFALQQQGFPACESGTCLRVFGFFAPPRSCGPLRKPECGVPPLAIDASGAPENFYVSTTSLRDPRFEANDPRSYLDARTVPHFVLPDGERGPFGLDHGIQLGDIALIVRGNRGVFAVFGDAGPPNKLGEASAAVITRLNDEPDSIDELPAAISSGVTTLILRGSRNLLTEMPPRSASVIAEAGQRAMEAAGGLAALSGCPGLGAVIEIAEE